MKVEVTIDKTKKLPHGAVDALRAEFSKRLAKKFGDVSLVIKLASQDGLNVTGGPDKAKENVSKILQETWESADEWFYR